MKFLHLADLHFGKRVHEFSMLEDLRYILDKILGIIDDTAPDAVVIAGDLYDRTVPATESVQLCDWFLSELVKKNLHTFIISGNHDSAERVAFGSKLMEASKTHISPVYHGDIAPIKLQDAFGEINFYLLPFVKPANVRAAFPEESIESYTDAVRVAIEHMQIDPTVRNVLVSHQFVTNAPESESGVVSVGGTDQVDCAVFEPFDYTALGHIHKPGDVTDKMRYCGSPLKFAFSAAKHTKSVTVVTMEEKGKHSIELIPLIPLHDMVEIKGDYMTLTARSYYQNLRTDDYYHITLTDEQDIPNAIANLRVIYPNLMKLDYDNARTRMQKSVDVVDTEKKQSPLELFASLYEIQNNAEMSNEQTAFVEEVIRSVWEEQV